jgi:hypothetical protein
MRRTGLSPSSTLQTETGQQYAIRKALEAEQAKKAKKAAQNLRPPAVVTPGHEVDVESVITRTEKGTPNRQSHLGKLVALCEEHGWEVKAGASEYFTGDKIENKAVVEGRIERLLWLQGHSGEKAFTYTADVCTLNGRPIPFKELCIVIDSTEKEEA